MRMLSHSAPISRFCPPHPVLCTKISPNNLLNRGNDVQYDRMDHNSNLNTPKLRCCRCRRRCLSACLNPYYRRHKHQHASDRTARARNVKLISYAFVENRQRRRRQRIMGRLHHDGTWAVSRFYVGPFYVPCYGSVCCSMWRNFYLNADSHAKWPSPLDTRQHQ